MPPRSSTNVLVGNETRRSRKLRTADGAEQHLVVGSAVLQKKSNGAALRLSSPCDLEWDTGSDTAVVRVGQADQSLSKGGEADGAEEDLSGIHPEVSVYRRVSRVYVIEVVSR